VLVLVVQGDAVNCNTRPHVPEVNRFHQYKLVCFIVWQLFVLSKPLPSELFWQLLITTATTRKAIRSWQMPSEI